MSKPEKLNDETLKNVSGGAITSDEALAKALAYVNLKSTDIDFAKPVELDYEHGKKVYEVKFYQGGVEYELDVDAEDGTILKYEKDYD